LTESSELLFLEGVGEVEESGTLIGLLLLVGKGEGALGVVRGASEDLELIELGDDKLDNLGGALLERLSAIFLAHLLQLFIGSLEELLNDGHKVLLGESTLVELEGVDNVNDGLTLSLIELVIGGNLDLLVAGGGVAGLDFPDGVAVGKGVGVGVREHLVSGENASENFHGVSVFSVLSEERSD